MHPLLLHARSLADDRLVASARSLVTRERHLTASLVACLAEIDGRRLALAAGYSSLFDYCQRVLGLSEGESYGRIEAARAARRFPRILDMLDANELTMTTAALVARHLTPENCDEVLQAARGKTKAAVKEVVAGLAPKPDVKTSVRCAPTPCAPRIVAPGSAASVVPPAPAAPPKQQASPSLLEPLAPQRFHYNTTLDAETRELLLFARDLDAHPGADDTALLKEALALLVRHRLRQKFAVTKKPRPARGTQEHSRHIPAPVKRAVYLRDLGRCAFVGSGGHRCHERRFLELHHVRPYEAGGDATVGNVQLRCRSHNAHEQRLYFTRGGVGPDRVAAG